MQDKPIVHIVDDDHAVRDSLTLLMTSEDIASSAYASAEEFLAHDATEKPGCLLLDVRMPGMNGLQLLKSLKEKDISIPVIFITGHGDVPMAVEAMKCGASDFIEKPFNNEHLLNLVNKCFTEYLDRSSSYEHRKEMLKKLNALTKREREVMNMLVDGKKNKLIAQELGISPRTVELHRAKVMEKLQAHSLSEIVKTALLIT